MQHHIYSIGEQIRKIRTDRDPKLTQDEFRQLLTSPVSLRTIIRWEQDDGVIPTEELIGDLARIAGTTKRRIRQMLGIDDDENPPQLGKLVLLNFTRLVSVFGNDPMISQALEWANRARQLDIVDGNLPAALRWMTAARKQARDAKAIKLELYLLVFEGSLTEMVGKPDDAENLLTEARQTALRFRQRALDRKNQRDAHTFLQVAARAYEAIHWCRWAVGDIRYVNNHIGELLDELDKAEDFHWLVRAYQLRARTALVAGDMTTAREAANLAVTVAIPLDYPYYLKNTLPLDTLPEYADYRTDQARLTKLDVLIVAGKFAEALQVYLSMSLREDVINVMYCHHWFDHAWQEYLCQMRRIDQNFNDGERNFVFSDWSKTLRASGDLHILAMNMLDQGIASRHIPAMSIEYIDRAIEASWTCGARPVWIESNLEKIILLTEMGKVDVANRDLNMLLSYIENIGNPRIETKYQHVYQVVTDRANG